MVDPDQDVSRTAERSERSMKKGKLFVISGPSGTGKGTICDRIVSENDDVALSVSMTTRAPREGEADGSSYHFVSEKKFLETVENDGLLEYAKVYDHYYGTPKEAVLEKLSAGTDVILEIDTQGAMKIMEKFPEGVFIFIMPPSMDELRSRIEKRGKDSPESIELRLGEAGHEMSLSGRYDYRVVNDDIDSTVSRVEEIMASEHDKDQEKGKGE